jgi:hypothetical protein
MKNIFLFLLIFFCGCGYTTKGFFYSSNKIFIEPSVNKINIATENQRYSTYTSYPILIENKFTNNLTNKFNIDGHLKVVSEDTNSLKLYCEINNYTKEALRYNNGEDIDEQRLRLYVHMKLLDQNGKIIKERDIVGETTFFLIGPNSISETTAQENLVDDTARRTLEAVIEEWQT